MEKGITPALATILLMAITVAAAGTLYTLVQDYMDQGKDVDTELPVNVNSLQVQACYEDGSRTLLDLRNTANEDVNASEITVSLNGTILDRSDYDVRPEIVGSQSVFTIDMSRDFGSDTLIQLFQGEQEFEYECYNLD
jgi:flagellin-like protein